MGDPMDYSNDRYGVPAAWVDMLKSAAALGGMTLQVVPNNPNNKVDNNKVDIEVFGYDTACAKFKTFLYKLASVVK